MIDRKKDTKKEPKSGEVARLKKRIKRLEKEKRDLISEVKTMETALEKNVKFLKGSVEDCSVEDLIEAANNNQTLKELKDEEPIECPNCDEILNVINTNFGKILTCKCGYRSKV